MGEDVLIFAVLTTGTVLIVAHLARMLKTGMLHKTIREAISRDNPSVPVLLQGIEEPTNSGNNDDRTGAVLLALGLALFLFGLIQGDADDIRNAGGAALFPSLVGAALLLRYHLVKQRGSGV